MLYQCHFEQHYWVCAWSAVIGTVQVFHEVIYLVEINSCIYFSQQMILRNKCFYTYKFKLVSFLFILLQHFYHLIYYTTSDAKNPPFRVTFSTDCSGSVNSEPLFVYSSANGLRTSFINRSSQAPKLAKFFFA